MVGLFIWYVILHSNPYLCKSCTPSSYVEESLSVVKNRFGFLYYS